MSASSVSMNALKPLKPRAAKNQMAAVALRQRLL
jgi:hypothetical protein